MKIIIKILVVEDDIYIGDMLDEPLGGSGYQVVRAYSGTEAILCLKNCVFDLVLLDLNLPGLSGERVLSEINNIPVIVCSAKIGTGDKVSCVNNGAVDYTTKPCVNEELLARIRAHIRKSTVCEQKLELQDIVLDLADYTATIGAMPLKLTKTEFAILKTLIKSPTKVFSKSALLDSISELSKLATCYGFINKGKIIKEISADKLMQECDKCTVIEVNSAKNIAVALGGLSSKNTFKELTTRLGGGITANLEKGKLVIPLSFNNVV